MILLNDFYAIESSHTEDNVHSYSIHINPLHTIFDGHFPDNPVTPGVVQMEIIKELLSLNMDRSMALDTMGTCKFLSILNPKDTPDVLVKLVTQNDEEGKTKVTASIESIGTENSTSFFKMNAVYK